MGESHPLGPRLFLHRRVWPPLAWVVVLLLFTPACMVAGDTAPAHPLLTAAPAARGAAAAQPPAQAVVVVTATAIPVPTRAAVVLASPAIPTPTSARAPEPTPSPSRAVVQALSPTTAVHAGPKYTVQQGDSLSALSRRFDVPVADIARANGLATDAGLRTGDALSLPAGVWSDRLAIHALQPDPGARVSSPIVVRGTAATFEGLVVVEALDANGARLAQVSAKAASPDAGLHGPFEATLSIPSSASDRAVTIRLYWPSPRDGSPSDEIRIPVTVAASS